MKIRFDSVDLFRPELHLTLELELILVGCDGDAHMRLEDRWVSRRHCQIRQVNGSLEVQDLRSRYGTLVNGAQVHRSSLVSGDLLTIGVRTFRVSYQRPECELIRSMNGGEPCSY